LTIGTQDREKPFLQRLGDRVFGVSQKVGGQQSAQDKKTKARRNRIQEIDTFHKP
jgi:hypothetical protein